MGGGLRRYRWRCMRGFGRWCRRIGRRIGRGRLTCSWWVGWCCMKGRSRRWRRARGRRGGLGFNSGGESWRGGGGNGGRGGGGRGGGLDFAIVDEVDSILIDEARTPLIISGPAHDDAPKYKAADDVVRKLIDANKP